MVQKVERDIMNRFLHYEQIASAFDKFINKEFLMEILNTKVDYESFNHFNG
jgi:hypothetical protein